jgi:hypothetical protein
LRVFRPFRQRAKDAQFGAEDQLWWELGFEELGLDGREIITKPLNCGGRRLRRCGAGGNYDHESGAQPEVWTGHSVWCSLKELCGSRYHGKIEWCTRIMLST